MRQHRALPQQRPMIAKQRDRRHLRGQTLQRRRGVGILPRRVAGRDAREIRGPGDQPVERMGEPRLALVLAAGVDARRQRGTGQRAPAAPSAASQARRSACTAGSAQRERAQRRARRLREREVGRRRRPAPRATRAPSAGVGQRRGKLAAAADEWSPARAPAGPRPGSGTSPAAAPRASSAARSPPPRSSAPPGAMTATLARWR